VNGEVDGISQQRFLDLLGEQTLPARLRQRNILNLVAAGLDDL